ncbi:hypothetical protein BJ508DRAFT_334654 [Ascobolus immersus RN42]|uniref:Uncharacterized protein n=1 Tax=Ascobolus immersus RN42 TaxID=1160509 RepID=A0A3N4HJS2_ASCIM|nr:hypothetical protein BJ508DRAFT_334654 [Ascobolus immersus RN42]
MPVDSDSILEHLRMEEGDEKEHRASDLLRSFLCNIMQLSELELAKLHPSFTPEGVNLAYRVPARSFMLYVGNRLAEADTLLEWYRRSDIQVESYSFSRNWTIMERIAQLELFMVIISHLLPAGYYDRNDRRGLPPIFAKHCTKKLCGLVDRDLCEQISALAGELMHQLSCLACTTYCLGDLERPLHEYPAGLDRDEFKRFRKGLASPAQIFLVEKWLDVVMWEIRNSLLVLFQLHDVEFQKSSRPCSFYDLRSEFQLDLGKKTDTDGYYPGGIRPSEWADVYLELDMLRMLNGLQLQNLPPLVNRLGTFTPELKRHERRSKYRKGEYLDLTKKQRERQKFFPGLTFLLHLRCESIEARIMKYLNEEE